VGLLLNGREEREEEGREWEEGKWGGKRREGERKLEGDPPSDRSGYGPATDRAFLGVHGPNYTKLREDRAIIAALHFCFRIRISCCIFKCGRLKVELCNENDAKFRTF